MRSSAYLAILLLAAVLVGCEGSESSPGPAARSDTDRMIVRSLNDMQVANAVVRQRTLWPYHFHEGSADLNDLGMRDVRILAGHFRRTAGNLNVRQGDATASLYDARVRTVVNALTEASVERRRIRVEDGLPGGRGMPSHQVVSILSEEQESQTGEYRRVPVGIAPITGGQ